MIGRVVFLSAAAYATAGSLRGEGVEEVGEQIEFFPPDDLDVGSDRRHLVDKESEARAMMEDYFDEWPEEAVVGHVVEHEDEIYVDEYQPDGEEDTFEDIQPLGGVVGEGTVEEGEAKDEQEPPSADDTLIKTYAPDPNSVTFEGTQLTGEAIDQYDRRDAACVTGKSRLNLVFSTDRYGYETGWELTDTNSNSNTPIDSGPPVGRNYADESTYWGTWCLSRGNYRVKFMDKDGDGMCSNPKYGCGKIKISLDDGNGAPSLTPWDLKDGSQDWSKPWSEKNLDLMVGIDPRIDGVNNRPSSSQWCEKVRSKHQIPRGTCTTPGGTQGHRVRVTTKVDKFGKETSWKITKNNVVKMKMEPIIEPNKSKSVEMCLPAGKYKLDVRDLDGICCRHGEGFFKLIVNGEQLLDGGRFVGSIQHEFQLGFDWISTMSERDCEWYWAHDYRRRDWHTRCYEGKYCNKSYRRLKWSPALRADAQEYADKLLDTCEETGIKHDTTVQGENLAKNKGFGAWGQLYPADKITKRFVDNEEFWGWNRNAHLTQAMWYPSRYIGCADSYKSMGGGKMCRMQVCRFAKAGNCMMGKYNSEQGVKPVKRVRASRISFLI